MHNTILFTVKLRYDKVSTIYYGKALKKPAAENAYRCPPALIPMYITHTDTAAPCRAATPIVLLGYFGVQAQCTGTHIDSHLYRYRR